MYVTFAPILIKQGYKDRHIAEQVRNARSSVNDEPGCLRFDVFQDPNEPNRIWLHEVFTDEAAFQDHLKMPHFIRFRDAVKGWFEEETGGAGIGAHNIWPTDGEWR